jgi:SAM-dependent methyltransferase
VNEDPAVLLSALGAELLGRIASEFPETVPGLAAATRLRREYPVGLVAAAVTQHELRLAARSKFARASQMLFTRAGYEQSSSEMIARHRAARLAGGANLADLCCGIGGDLAALAATGEVAGRRLLAVDLNPVHARLARHNADVYGAAGRVHAVIADVRDIPLTGIDAVFIDPARRDDARRFRAGTCEPPLAWCFELTLKVPAVCVKAAPGLDTSLVPAGWEVEFIADGRDLKEAVLWSPALSGPAARRATILPGGFTMVRHPGPPVDIREPGEFLLDPSPAVTRAGLVEDLARQVGAWKIDPQIAFLSTASEVTTSFARTLTVIDSAPWTEKRFAARLRELGVGAADLRRRGLAGDVEQIRRRLRLQGPHRATIVLTRVRDKPWGLICADPGSPLASHPARGTARLAARASQQDAARVQGLADVLQVVTDHADQPHAERDRWRPAGIHDSLHVRVGQGRHQSDRLRVHRRVI